MQYNTTRKRLSIREYGRGVQELIDHLLTINDKTERQAAAEQVVEIMSILNPATKNIEDYKHKMWDHLIMMSGYKLEIESPYKYPTAELKEAKPKPIPYPKTKIKWNHLGKKFEILLNNALEEQDPEKKQGYIHTLVLFMKIAYSNWHNEKTQDDTIIEELSILSKGKLVYEPGRFSDFVDGSDVNVIMHKSFAQNNLSGVQKKNKNKNQRNNKFKKFRR